MDGPSAGRLGKRLTTPHQEETTCYEILHRALELTHTCEPSNEPSGSIKDWKFLE